MHPTAPTIDAASAVASSSASIAASALSIFQTEVLGLVRRAAVNECLRRSRNALRVFAVHQALQGFSVRLQGAQESGDRGQQALLQTDEGQFRQRCLVRRQLSQCAALRSSPYAASRRQRSSSGASFGRPAIVIGFDLALRERLTEATQDRPSDVAPSPARDPSAASRRHA